MLLDAIEKRRRLQAIARRARTALFGDTAAVDRFLHAGDDQSLAQLGDTEVAILERLGKVVAGIDVHEWKWKPRRPKRELGEPEQDDRVLATREEQAHALTLRDELAKDVNRLVFEGSKVAASVHP
jgi:hypothetical protein